MTISARMVDYSGGSLSLPDMDICGTTLPFTDKDMSYDLKHTCLQFGIFVCPPPTTGFVFSCQDLLGSRKGRPS